MKSRPFHLAATHALALLLGLAGAWFIATPAPLVMDTAAGVSRAASRARPPGAAGLASAGDFQQARHLLGAQPMNQADREAAQKLYFEAWARRDPVGLLAFLDHCRVWPDSLSLYVITDLARDRPDLVLDFAIRNGCPEAAHLLTWGDLQTVIRLIEALPVEDMGKTLREIRDEAYQKLGASGVAAHQSTPANLQGQALYLLQQGDIDGFFDRFARVGDEHKQRELARELGSGLREEKLDDATLAIILRLPAEFRDEAAYGLSALSADYPETRAMNRDWIVKLMDHGMRKPAENLVRELFAEDDPRVNAEMTAWIQTLPTEEAWLPVARELVTHWWSFDDAAMVRGLATLPPGSFRDELLADRARHLLHNTENYTKPQLDRLLLLFDDPELREKFGQWEWGDPFAGPPGTSPFDADPFAEPKE